MEGESPKNFIVIFLLEMNTFVTEKGITIRPPSTANLMIDSEDGPKQPGTLTRLNPWNFQIYKPQALQNGFFTRIATTEVVLEWNVPNITNDLSNNVLFLTDASGVEHTLTFAVGFYTVEQLLERMVSLVGNIGITMTINYDPSVLADYPCNIDFDEVVQFAPTPLAYQLGLGTNPGYVFYLLNVDLRLYRYLDFISPDLTYAQDTKDATTNSQDRDVLCRWYMCYDNATPQVDAYGFPILMGYTPFQIRRLYNPPKQIKWDTNLPVGALKFEVYGITADPASPLNNKIVIQPVTPPNTISFDAKSNWLMTLQLSEN